MSSVHARRRLSDDYCISRLFIDSSYRQVKAAQQCGVLTETS